MSVGPQHWNILIVDDEPDVLSVTKLALQDVNVDGLPLNILTAASKAAAIDLLAQEKSGVSQLAVAFIDVVMESDTAGLELCQHIRDEMKNRVSQLYIRTGQPGVAPERSVIDQYDISGYFTKNEVTEDKLYSLVKSGVRQFTTTQAMQNVLTIVEHLMDVGNSKPKLQAALAQLTQSLGPADSPADNGAYVAVDGQPVFGPVGWDEKTALALQEKLDKAAGTPLGPDGDKYVRDDENHLLVTVAGNSSRPAVYALVKYHNRFPESQIMTMRTFLRTFATLWARAV